MWIFLLFLLSFTILKACNVTTYEDIGFDVAKNKRSVELDVPIVTGLTLLKIDGNEVLSIRQGNMYFDPNCEKISNASLLGFEWLFTFETKHKDEMVKLETDGAFQYRVYIDDELVSTIRAVQ